MQGHRCGVGRFAEVLQYIRADLGEVARLQVASVSGPLQAGQQQQISNQLLQPPALVQHPIKGRCGDGCPIRACDRAAHPAAFSLHQRQQAGQRCAQFMGHIGAELFLAAIGLQQWGHGKTCQPPAGRSHSCHRQGEHTMAQPPQPSGVGIEGCQAAADLQVPPVLLAGAMGLVQMNGVAQPSFSAR